MTKSDLGKLSDYSGESKPVIPEQSKPVNYDVNGK